MIEHPQNEQSQPHQTQKKQIKRTKKREAILKIKQVQNNIDTMRRRNLYLSVKDDLNRSLTIQHQRKLSKHDYIREQVQQDLQEMDRVNRQRMAQLEAARDKNIEEKNSKEKKIMESFEKIYCGKVDDYQTIRTEKVRNQQQIMKFKENQLKNRQQRRQNIYHSNENSRISVNRYKQDRSKKQIQQRVDQSHQILSTAAMRMKQLQKLSKMEEQMLRKSSQSMQASQVVRNRLREVLGDQRRFTKLPSIKKSGLSSARTTGQTQLIVL